MLDSLFAFVGVMTPDGILIEVNHPPLAAAGLEPKDVLGKPVWETYWWNYSPEAQEQLRAAIARAGRGEASRYDVDVRMANGAMMTIDFMLAPLRDEAGRIEFLVQSAVDISERRQAEQHLRESERRLKLAQQAAHIGTFEWNVRTGVNAWSPELAVMYGLAPGEFGGTQLAWEQLVHPEDREAAIGCVRRAFETGEPVEGEWRVAWRDGSIHWLVGRFQVLRDASGTPLSLVGVNIDITERKLAEAALRESEERFRTMANAIPQLAWIAKPDGYIDWYNQRWYEYTGTTPEEMEGWGWQSVHDPQQLPEVLEQWNRSIATGEPFNMVFPLRGRDGVFRPFLTRIMPLKDDQGRVQQWFGTNTDISERFAAEQSLQKQNRRLRLLWEAAGILLSTDDPDAMLQGLFEKIASDLCIDACFNFMMDEAGDSLYLQFCAGIPPEVAASIKTLNLGQAVCGKVALTREPIVATCIQQSDQPEVQLVKGLGFRTYACNPLLAGGQLLGTLSFASRTCDRFDDDETEFLETISHYVTIAYERMRLLNALREADRRKNELLAMLAHELRNPLAPIRAAVEYMRLTGQSDPDHAWARDMIDRQLTNLVHLTDDLLEISRITRGKIRLRKESTDLTRVLANAIEACRPSIDGKAHRLELDFAPGEMPIFGDPVRLEQIFVNLLVNAAKYTDEGGMIRVTCHREGGHGVVRVRDSGAGIPKEMLERIFEPFAQIDQSLDRSQGGLGIGLTLVKTLAEMLEGTVRAQSRGPGTGSEFTVSLPLSISPIHPPPAKMCLTK
ncbi:MAG: PAS domain S-box protein [Planctomycetaceae bacterium]|nr:PAS domain S-box protein [Planctomycetaceae bacterium]